MSEERRRDGEEMDWGLMVLCSVCWCVCVYLEDSYSVERRCMDGWTLASIDYVCGIGRHRS